MMWYRNGEYSKKANVHDITKKFFLEQKYFILGDIFKIAKNLITSAFFLSRHILNNRHALAKASNATLESLKMIMCLTVRCFSVSNLNMAKQAMLFDSPQHGF